MQVMQLSQKILVLALFSLVCGVQVILAEDPESCTYTFTVSNGSHLQCETADRDDLERMQYILSKQESAITGLLADVERLEAVAEEWKDGLGTLTLAQEEIHQQMQDQGGSNEVPSTTTMGTTYIRWGNSQCPDTASKLYEGYAAKSHALHGGGVNYICLPNRPHFHPNSEGGHQSRSYVYGTEYEANEENSPLLPDDKTNGDVVCAMCEVTGRSRMIVLLAHKTCPSEWTQEYEGHLMSQNYKQMGATFECVDSALGTTRSGASNRDGGLFYMAETVCGSLPCPPYSEGMEIRCRVCTK